MTFINDEYQDCIDYLNDCAQVCFECIKKILDDNVIKEPNKLLKNLMDCAIHSQMTVGFIARDSVHKKEMALLSAHLAKVCAEECEHFDEEVTNITAQVCLEAAKNCVEIFENK